MELKFTARLGHSPRPAPLSPAPLEGVRRYGAYTTHSSSTYHSLGIDSEHAFGQEPTGPILHHHPRNTRSAARPVRQATGGHRRRLLSQKACSRRGCHTISVLHHSERRYIRPSCSQSCREHERAGVLVADSGYTRLCLDQRISIIPCQHVIARYDCYQSAIQRICTLRGAG